MITSCIPGRVRLRHPRLHDPDESGRLCALLRVTEGILDVTANPRTGSLLVRYDTTVVDEDDLARAAARCTDYLAASGYGQTSGKQRGRGVQARAGFDRRETARLAKRGMMVTLGATLLLGLAGREKAHVAAGTLFTLCNAYHIYAYRRQLLR